MRRPVPRTLLRGDTPVEEQLAWLTRVPGGVRLSQVDVIRDGSTKTRWVAEAGGVGGWGTALCEALHSLLTELSLEDRAAG
jgi:hypothetical protein